MKIGRNEPCPCGSGKKYKRCCLQQDERAKAQEEELPQGAAEQLEPGQLPLDVVEGTAEPDEIFDADSFIESLPPLVGGFSESLERSPYAELREHEDTPFVRRLRKKDREEWILTTVPGLASLTTEEIQQRLAGIGIDASREAFLIAAEGRTSAWEIGVAWVESIPRRKLPGFAQPFCSIAACELWKRLLPERPSTEMLDDWIVEGYECDGDNRLADVVGVWLRVWDGLRLLLTADVTTAEAADSVVRGRAFLECWVHDFVGALFDAAARDEKLGERGVRCVDEILEQFGEEDESFTQRMHAELGGLLFRAGRPEDGERALRELIDEYPDQAVGYCYLAAELEDTDPAAALAILERARDVPVVDGEDWDLDMRIEDLETSSDEL